MNEAGGGEPSRATPAHGTTLHGAAPARLLPTRLQVPWGVFPPNCGFLAQKSSTEHGNFSWAQRGPRPSLSRVWGL